MVSPDFKLVLCTFQELPPLFHCTDDRQHLLVMYLVVPLYLGERLREEGDGEILALGLSSRIRLDCEVLKSTI